MSILIRKVRLKGEVVDVLIRGNRFDSIGADMDAKTDVVIDGAGKAILPSFHNAHTHAAMTLLRGYADDMELHTWLSSYIWPFEARLTEDDIYWGAKLACLEMIKSGTTFFADMYWHWKGTARAVEVSLPGSWTRDLVMGVAVSGSRLKLEPYQTAWLQ